MQNYSDSEGEIGIFTPEEMAEILFRTKPEAIPYLTIGAFAGLRSAELKRLDWRHVYLNRGFIEAAATITKTRRRLVPICDNLRAWLEPHAQKEGPIFLGYVPGMTRFMRSVGIRWILNGLRLSIIHDTARVALECGNSPEVIFAHYRELTTPQEAEKWFGIMPGPRVEVVPSPFIRDEHGVSVLSGKIRPQHNAKNGHRTYLWFLAPQRGQMKKGGGSPRADHDGIHQTRRTAFDHTGVCRRPSHIAGHRRLLRNRLV
jgi:hypothetical protein